jgi:hypothetical protein
MGLVKRFAVLAVFAIACGAVPAHAQTLALAYHSGGVFKYKIHTTANEQVMNIPIRTELSALETATVKSVDSSGAADLSIELTNITMKYTYGSTTSTTTGMSLPPVELKIAADGRIVSVNGIAAMSALSFGSATSGSIVSAVLPDTPVKPGDTWSKTYDQAIPVGSGSGGIHVTTTSKYLRDETLQGINAAVVETKSDATINFATDTSKLLPSGSTKSSFPVPTGGAGSSYAMTLKGTVISDVTTWIDPNGRRIMKSHETSTTDISLDFGTSSGPAMPGTMGPMAIKGDQTLDLTPA